MHKPFAFRNRCTQTIIWEQREKHFGLSPKCFPYPRETNAPGNFLAQGIVIVGMCSASPVASPIVGIEFFCNPEPSVELQTTIVAMPEFDD